MKCISVGMFSWKKPEILRQTLQSYRNNGLLKYPENFCIYFNEISEKDIAVAKDFGINYLGTTKNIGIKNALIELIKQARAPYFMFLENDWFLEENSLVTEKRLNDGIEILQNNLADVVRYRHAKEPGYPLTSAKFCKKGLHKMPSNYLIDLVHLTSDPSVIFPDVIEKKSINNENYFFACAQNASFTNNPCLYKTQFFKELVERDYPFADNQSIKGYAKLKNTEVKNVSLEVDIIPFWEKSAYKIAMGPGLFSHKDYLPDSGFKKFLKFFYCKRKLGNRRETCILGIRLKKDVLQA